MGKYSAVESLLIEEVKKYPGLWKTTDPEYKNRAAKDSAWEAITETVNAAANTTYSVMDYRDKIWKNLRDSYVRVLSGRTYKSSIYDSGDITKHPHLEPLSFLKIYINRRKSTTKKLFQDSPDIKPDVCKSESGEDATMSDHTDMLSNDHDVPLSMAESIPTSSNTDHEAEENGSDRAVKRPYLQSAPNEQIDKGALDCKIMEYLSRSGATPCPCTQSREERCEMDADTLFGQSIAAQLRSMDKRTNATAKVKIQQILLELQFPENPNNS
ncbi:uncharacterized protein LOC110247263 [Exaiptasia diaphana]|uniref:MADF domain-containing protein n=1 Tax=Exaiptasia diaphana TaxID=2652724 RepID=A0A913XT82_EXADI|nr:uncharacterized protein LOC110247263 [Exaiptasia diaphana]KXJ24703.1 hypothetical protein AC249_AIPGENE20947 [Exaiptasia diaphana]